ncbi:membrane-bound PQQ-dependent dehydrogenase, glucose/quinate/shikimate family [Agrobacterium sp. Azo12]|uniref:membrane-bound PQQ-dependent dehydrogenase, glucose/quinate/shikimate family n=1 Tax=Agrobacterium sp. Azo12 TaxID=3031129 RepID=UPI0023D88D66|nr:membrane-bound PQQ-dependent dehydrogenase, glucose/quinate/shikimate family [Agrobacterium sp. Azo12]MDO5898461.1 membrane-bound PQQ-dependent dehydrogenase, glucose/quinate/shikimate family [Agrobacterium sp. Azo12]
MLARLGGIVSALLGAAILYYGARLAIIGGSFFYVVMGIGLLIAGIQIARQRQNGLGIYALTLAASFIWTLYEVGLDKWQWIPRGALIIFIGLLLSLPFVVNGLRDKPAKLWSFSLSNGPLALRTVVALIAVMGLAVWFIDPMEKQGTLEKVATAGDTAVDPSGVAYPANDWIAYGGTNLGQRYSALKDINTTNITGLKVAWEHHTGDLREGDAVDAKEYTFEATPIKVNGMLYFCTPHNIVQALEPETGKLAWSFDPKMQRDNQFQHQTCRGVSYDDSSAYAPPADTDPVKVQAISAAVAECPRRIIASSVDARLYALNADTGALCTTFGENGYVDLKAQMPNLQRATYQQTSAPLVTKDLIILGSAIADNYYENNPSGVIRAYDVRTGEIVWKFDAGKPDDTRPLQAGELYEPNSAVAWTQFAADENLGLVYVPFGNKSPDQVGVFRSEEDQAYVDALAALDVKTGRMVWKFQTSYHDLWDRDNPSQPVLLNLPHDGADVPAILIPTKIGNIWVLDRRDGKAIQPVRDMKVSTETDIPNEKLSPVQPMSGLSFTPAPLTEADMWGTTPFDQIECRVTFRSNRYDGNSFTPPTTTGSIVWPGNIGVFNWGSVAVDPVNRWMIATPQYLPYVYKLFPRPEGDLNKRMFGKPGEAGGESKPGNENLGGPYAVSISHMRSSLQVPCNTPPWGVRVGVNLADGTTAWKHRNGTVAGQKVAGIQFPIPFEMGMLAHGGTLTTAGGVAFTGAALDDIIRAYDMQTGKTLWQHKLPAGGQATPMTYRGKDDKQYVVIAAGGHGSLGTTAGDSVIAYRLD